MYADLLTSEKIAFRTIDQFVNEPSTCLDREHVISKLRAIFHELEVWFQVNNDTDYHTADVMRFRGVHWLSVRWHIEKGLDDEALAEARSIVGA